MRQRDKEQLSNTFAGMMSAGQHGRRATAARKGWEVVLGVVEVFLTGRQIVRYSGPAETGAWRGRWRELSNAERADYRRRMLEVYTVLVVGQQNGKPPAAIQSGRALVSQRLDEQ